MLIAGLALCYLTGFGILLTISRKYSLAEIVGYSFLLGIAAQSFFMFFLDLANITFNRNILIGANLVAIVAMFALNYKKLKEFKLDPNPSTFLQLKNINIPAVLVGCVTAYLFYCITIKCLFWPALEHDSIKGFDKVARIISLEGKLNLSIFQYHMDRDDGIYAPMYSNAMAYVYFFGAELPKIITTLYFLSTLLIFFDITRKYIGSTGSSIATFLLMITPEYFAHAALTLSNLPVTAYAGTGALCTVAWLDKREEKYFWLGAILIGLVAWTRTDMIVFAAGAMLVMGIDFLRRWDWKKTAIYSVIAIAPFIMWDLYIKYKVHVSATTRFNLGMGFNREHYEIVKGYTVAFLTGKLYSYNGSGAIDGAQLYGMSFVLFLIILLINVILLALLLYRKSDWRKAILLQMNILLLFFASLFLYCLIFYLFDEKVQNDSLWALMSSSFKRGLFCFLPLAYFYSFSSYASSWFFQRLEKFRTGS